MSKITHVIVELNMPIDTKWFRPDINDEYWGEGKPLIMRKDCKYWGEDGYHNGCKYATVIMGEQDYCSMADRKEDA